MTTSKVTQAGMVWRIWIQCRWGGRSDVDSNGLRKSAKDSNFGDAVLSINETRGPAASCHSSQRF